MNIEITKREVSQLLDKYYQISSQSIPPQRIKAYWQADNKRGLFLGIIHKGEVSHIARLHDLLAANLFEAHQEFSTTTQLTNQQHPRTFLDEMFTYYVLPFHKQYSDSSSCHTPLTSSNSPSRINSADDLDYVPEFTHKDFKKTVNTRDGVCVFCWGRQQLEGAHIIAQKNIPMTYDETSIFRRAGLEQKHQVQNCMLLCKVCHGEFDSLKRYVDVVDGALVVKVVNMTNDSTSEKHKECQRAVGAIKNSRLYWQEDWIDIDNRTAVDANGEMALYFVTSTIIIG
jgi:hypothetical protein